MGELADPLVLGTSAVRRPGSTPGEATETRIDESVSKKRKEEAKQERQVLQL